MSDRLRLFYAIDLSEPARAAVAELQRYFAEHTPPGAARWVPPGQVHLTLQFLGHVPAERVPALASALASAAAASQRFHLELRPAGAFPEPRFPRVLWVGLGGDVEALAAFQSRLAGATADLAEHEEERAFQPHLTIGRAGHHGASLRALADALAGAPVPPACCWEVTEAHLFRSDRGAQGPVYTKLATARLGGG